MHHPAQSLAVLTALWAGSLHVGAAKAQDVPEAPERPEYSINAQEDDSRFLRDPAGRTDPLDGIKYIPIGEIGNSYAYLGGNLRAIARAYDEENWGDRPGFDDVYHRRIMLHGGVVLADRARLFVELKHGGAAGSRFPQPPSEDDDLDLNQGFAELTIGEGNLVRVGRQELHYGRGLLISVREGPNIRQSHDAVLARLTRGDWRVDLLLAAPVETRPGVFDDRREDGAALWTVYAARKRESGSELDLYYIGDRRNDRVYANARGDEERHSVGVRWSDTPGAWTLGAEAVVQFGKVEGPLGGAILAWTLYGSAAYRWESGPGSPLIGVEFGVASGDGDPDDRALGTFRAPQPPGRYFGNANPLGPSNLGGITPSVEFSLTERTTLSAATRLFWRVSDRDGIYNPPGQLLRSGDQSDARFVGVEPTFSLQHQFDRHLSLEVTAAYFFAGRFLRETPPGRDVTLGEVILAYRF